MGDRDYTPGSQGTCMVVDHRTSTFVGQLACRKLKKPGSESCILVSQRLHSCGSWNLYAGESKSLHGCGSGNLHVSTSWSMYGCRTENLHSNQSGTLSVCRRSENLHGCWSGTLHDRKSQNFLGIKENEL